MKNMKLFLVILMLFALVVYGCAKQTPPAETQDTATADVDTNTPAAVDTNAPTAEATTEQTITETAQADAQKESANVASTEFVEIKDFGFSQATLTVTKGSTVTWSQEDDAKHSVVSDEGYFESPLLEKGEKWSYTFNDAGTYNYHCAPHQYMTGTIVVE